MSVSVATEKTGKGVKATARISAVRESDRAAIRRSLQEKGFDHAIATIAHGVAVDLVPTAGRDIDARLELMAGQAETAVLDALAGFAHAHGWKGPVR